MWKDFFKHKLPMLIFCIFSQAVIGQICEGNLGDNIFDAGDFGSGTTNILQTDPGIAPGYTYTTSPPPFDGLYTITRNTGEWSGNFGTWLDIPDNSNNSSGYMMVVNASFEPGLFYEQQVDDLCENTLYEFTADVINLIRAGVTDHIKPNVSFLIDGVEEYTSGDIPQNEAWNTYGFTFTTNPGQTSVTLSLRNNAPGGIGNDLAIDNIVFKPCGPLAQILPDVVERICEDGNPIDLEATIDGDQYPTPNFQWQESFDGGVTWVDIAGANGMTYTHTSLSSGLYYYRYLLANGSANLSNSKCRVVSNIKIVEVITKFWTTIDTLCEGMVYTAGNNVEFTTSGIYVDSLTSSFGCDSIVTLDLTFLPDLGMEADLISENPTCFGLAEGNILIENIMGGYPEYAYFINGVESLETEFLNLPVGSYNIVITDRYDCVFEDSIEIRNPEEFMIELGEDQQVELGDPVQIDLVANAEIIEYNWSPEVPCDTPCVELDFFPGLSQYYTLSAISSDTCVAVDSVFIEVEKVRKVYIPNIFSPNFDGNNDYFTPYAAIPNVLAVNRMQIFNRWGAVVYEQRNFQPNQFTEGWDGTFKGKAAETGVYLYLIEVLFLDGSIESYSGDLTLLR